MDVKAHCSALKEAPLAWMEEEGARHGEEKNRLLQGSCGGGTSPSLASKRGANSRGESVAEEQRGKEREKSVLARRQAPKLQQLQSRRSKKLLHAHFPPIDCSGGDGMNVMAAPSPYQQ